MCSSDLYYFTRTGNSEAIALELCKRYNCDIFEIDDHKDWHGPIGYLRAGYASMKKQTLPIEYEKPKVDDEILLCFPIWAGDFPPAIRTFLSEVKNPISAYVSSKGSTLAQRNMFKQVFDITGDYRKYNL